MYSTFVLVVLVLLGLSKGVPLTPSYNPQNFHPSGRIVGGIDAPEHHAPYMVALMVGGMMKSFTCGGSIVSQSTVLTAAHCIEPLVSWITGELLPTVRGQIGSNRLSKDYDVIEFSGHENHPEYDRWAIKNDIGILKVDKPIKHKNAKPIQLNLKWIGGGERVSITGWGVLSVWGEVSDRLQLLKVDTLSPEDCKKGVREAVNQLGQSPPFFPSLELCTRHKRGAGQGTCFGDSGSALVDERGKQVGLVSWGWPCALGHPDLHTRINAYKHWLSPVLNIDDVIEE